MLDWARLRRRVLENSLTAYHKGGYKPLLLFLVLLCLVLSSSRCDKVSTYIVISELVNGMVHRAVGAAAYLLDDCVLVDGVMGAAVDIVARVFGAGVERFLRVEFLGLAGR